MRRLFLNLFILSHLLLTLLPGTLAAEELCAVVKIEIAQELTLERQAFDARMKITNNLDTLSLDNVNIEVIFKDQDGIRVSATSDPNGAGTFFIRIDDMFGISDIAGAGTIPPASVAEIRWLIIPTNNASQNNPNGALYFVGAKLNYTYGGESQSIEVAPDTIVVKPLPVLDLDYFLTSDVIADDPSTLGITEPPEPYTLGVRIINNGIGIAHNVSIESAQPEITENDQGLALDFEIIGSYLNDQPVQNSLLINFGDIDSNEVTVGRWKMQSSLMGKFTSFSADFSHAEELGGQLTSLINTTTTHLLIRDVNDDLPGRDGLMDFLANDGTTKIYASEYINNPCNCSDVVDIPEPSHQLNGNVLSITPNITAGNPYVYIKLTNPFAPSEIDTKKLLRVVREGSVTKVLLRENSWLSKEQQVGGGLSYFVNLFDTIEGSNTVSSYTLYFSDAGALTIQPVPNKITYEGGQLSFIVTAVSPDTASPALSVTNPPPGSTFNDQGGGKGLFSWSPAAGQAGTYNVTFNASDGGASVSTTVLITVHPGTDIDGDGIPDAWEMKHFGNLDHGPLDDPDGDGLSNFDEQQIGTDPNNPDTDGDGLIDSVDDIPLFNPMWMEPVIKLMLD